MDRMLYVAMSGAKEIMFSQANNASNLANVNTPGFMEDLNQFRSMPVFGQGYPSRVYALDERNAINFERGASQPTGNPLDVALKGEGYIAVLAPDGTEAYTRRGDLQVADRTGLLTTGEGLPVIGNAGPISLPPYERIAIANDGTISIVPEGATAEELAIVDRLKLVQPRSEDLVKGDDGLLRRRDGRQFPESAGAELESGAIESSNVSVTDALVDMIELSRKFELQVKMMRTAEELDAMSAKLMQQV